MRWWHGTRVGRSRSCRVAPSEAGCAIRCREVIHSRLLAVPSLRLECVSHEKLNTLSFPCAMVGEGLEKKHGGIGKGLDGMGNLPIR